MVSGQEILREIALQELKVLYHPEYGLAAGGGRFEAFYPRDIERFTSLVLRHPSNFSIPGIVDMIELSLDKAFDLQGQEPTSSTDDQAPGQILHQWQNGFTPPDRMEELLNAGWTPYINFEGITEIRYFGADDTTSGIITAAFLLAQAKKNISGLSKRDEYLSRVWSNLKAAYNHEVKIADKDGDGLIVSIPKDSRRLLHHTERDSDSAFDLEGGIRPEPPFKYLGNNSIYLDALGNFAQIAGWSGEVNLEKEARERRQGGKLKYLEKFWMEEEGYLSPLVFGDNSTRAVIFTDEAVDGLYYGLVDNHQAKRIAQRLMKPDIMTSYGPRTRSINSTQFAENGAPAYWNGTVWPHRLAMAAEGMERYGFYSEAQIMDRALGRLIKQTGCVELVAVNRFGRLQPYTEEGRKVACKPHLFVVGAVLARTAA